MYDEEGWQYAVDFTKTFNAKKSIDDFVRRRKWVRIQVKTTKGVFTYNNGENKTTDDSLESAPNLDLKLTHSRSKTPEKIVTTKLTVVGHDEDSNS